MSKLSLSFTALLCAGAFTAHSSVFYVAPAGSDANAGTLTAPFQTIQRAQAAVEAGDTVYVRGGTYRMQSSQIAGYSNPYAYVTLLNKSGSATAGRINYWAYPGEQPVFDYADVDPNVGVSNGNVTFAAPFRVSAFEVTGSYIHLRGLEIVGVRVPLVATNVNTQSICISQSGAGGNNIYERMSMHDGQAIGFYLTRGGNTLVLNCDAYRNNDNVNTRNTTGTANGGNVDGFGAHPNRADYTGIVFRGCRAWLNSDDGYDCINSFAPITFENSWSFYNGYAEGFVSRGDGNGFKAGGYGVGTAPKVPATIPRNVVQRCLAVQNKASGFYANHQPGGNDWLNNTAYRNGVNFNMLNRRADFQADVPGYDHVLRNNVSLAPRSANADLVNYDPARCTIDHNTFLNDAVTVSADDFKSLNNELLVEPRLASGDLPEIDLLRLAPGSDLIDAGIDVGLPYNGSAPDLGYRETPATPPVVKAKAVTVAVDASGKAVITPEMVDDGSSSSNGALTLRLSQTTFDCANIGAPVTVTLTGTDAGGQSASATALVTVVDQLTPTLTAPAKQLLCYSAEGYAVPALTASDNCGVASVSYVVTGATVRSGSGADASGSFNVGVSTITWTVRDGHDNSATGSTTVTVNAPLTASIPAVYALGSQQGAANTLYLGYGPVSLTLVATPAGGTAPYTYQWSTGQNTPSISVAAAGTYTVQITDAVGCSVAAAQVVRVVAVACGNKGDKVLVCHNGAALCIAPAAVEAHLKHGDQLGACTQEQATTGPSGKVGALQASVYPNPVLDNLTISVADAAPGVTVTLYNATGAVVLSRTLTENQSIVSLTGLPAGVYYAQVVSGQQIARQKIVKE